MTKEKILRIQIATDMQEILRNMKDGVYEKNEKEYERDAEKLLEKVRQLQNPLWALVAWKVFRTKVLGEMIEEYLKHR